MKPSRVIIFACMIFIPLAYACADDPLHLDAAVYLRYTTNRVKENPGTEVVHGFRMGLGGSADYEIIPRVLRPGLQGEIATDPISCMRFFTDSEDDRYGTDDDLRMKYIPIELSLRLYNSFAVAGFELRPFCGLLALTINYRESCETHYSDFAGRGFAGAEFIWEHFGLEYAYFFPGSATHFAYKDKTVYLMDKNPVHRFSFVIHVNPKTE